MIINCAADEIIYATVMPPGTDHGGSPLFSELENVS